MAASEDKVTRRERERAIAAFEVEEIGIPGFGIWTRDGIKALLDERAKSANDATKAAFSKPAPNRRQAKLDHQSEEELSLHLRELHAGDPAYDNLHSPAAIRRQEQRDYETDRYGY
jgi:hypothetical protein